MSEVLRCHDLHHASNDGQEPGGLIVVVNVKGADADATDSPAPSQAAEPTMALTIPSHLPTATYELRAIGDETVTAQLAVTAAAGGADPAPAADDPNQAVVPRERATIELAVILALVALAAVAGGLLVWGADRVRGGAGA